jgi:hypothetical protein
MAARRGQVCMADVVAFIQEGARTFAKPALRGGAARPSADAGVPSYMRPTSIVSGSARAHACAHARTYPCTTATRSSAWAMPSTPMWLYFLLILVF